MKTAKIFTLEIAEANPCGDTPQNIGDWVWVPEDNTDTKFIVMTGGDGSFSVTALFSTGSRYINVNVCNPRDAYDVEVAVLNEQITGDDPSFFEWGVSVYLDGVYAGNAPFTFSLPSGFHTLRMSAEIEPIGFHSGQYTGDITFRPLVQP